MEQIDNLKELINQGDVDTAIEQLDQLLQDTSVEKEKDTLYYLRGNAYRKKGDWKQALDNYQFAIDINPEGPAVQARKMVIDILNFYHKDIVITAVERAAVAWKYRELIEKTAGSIATFK